MNKRLLFALLLAGCAAPAGPVPPPASPLPTGTPAPSTTPTWTPSTTPIPTSTLRGLVHDELGQRLSEGAVTVVSLNPSNPFEQTVPVARGQYLLHQVPAGVQLAITASRPGWTPRTRLETLVPDLDPLVNFGTPLEAYDRAASPYFLSSRPEITAVEPLHDARLAAPATLSYKLTLSEPLDEANRRRLASALRLLPANAAAGGGVSGARDLAVEAAVDAALSVFPYAVREGSALTSAPDGRAVVTWDESGREATLRFPAPLLAAREGPARYQVALAAGAPITDGQGHLLGAGATGDEAQFLRHVFRDPDMAIAEADFRADADRRWAALHRHAAAFELEEDDQAPRLERVSARVVGGETRIALYFDEPLVAFDGSAAGRRGANLFDPNRYVFAVSDAEAALAGLSLEVDAPAALDTDREGYAQREAFVFNQAGDAALRLALDEQDPSVVQLTIENARLFASGVTHIKARAAGIADPAGNVVSASAADRSTPLGRLEHP